MERDVMACNVGGIEPPIRIVLGIVLIGIGAFADLPPIGMGITLAIGAIGFCPVWRLLGITTCSMDTVK